MRKSWYPQLNDEAWLREQYVVQQRSLRSIADEIGACTPTVVRALRKLDIPTRVGGAERRYPQVHDRDWLAREASEKSARLIAEEVGCSLGTVLEAAREFGIELDGQKRRRYRKSETKAENVRKALRERFPEGRTGPRSANWRGGKRRVEHNGYVSVYVPDHPRGPRIAEHIIVAEQMLGRYLQPGEVVHHVNRVRDDNRPENLVVMTTGQHAAVHQRNVTAVEKQNERLKAEVKALQAESKALKAENARLRAENADLRAQLDPMLY